MLITVVQPWIFLSPVRGRRVKVLSTAAIASKIPGMQRKGWHPVLTCAEAGEWESRLLQGEERAEWQAMVSAGEAIAEAVLQDFAELGGFPADEPILVLAGKGHNGGDALLAAAAILRRVPAARATVFSVFGSDRFRPLALRAARALVEANPHRVKMISARDFLSASCGPISLCLDGIFGFQFRPPLADPALAVIRRINAADGIRLRAAVDLPSGLGAQVGAGPFRADFTYATGIVKEPLLLPEHAPEVGRLRYLDLGFFRSAEDGPGPGRSFVLTPEILDWLRGQRPPRSDKRTYGHVGVLGGSRDLPGAVLMTVQAALRSGAGLVTAFVPESLASVFAARAPEAMWVGLPETPAGGIALEGLHRIRQLSPRLSALAVGPGLGKEPETHALAAQAALACPVPLVLDADALQPEILQEVARQADRPIVVTPHAGELARLRGSGPDELSAAELRDFAKQKRIQVILKGSVTRVTDGEVLGYSLWGGPVLARGGTGDVLAGLTAGLLAQSPEDPLRAACSAVVWHGRAADRLARERGVVAVTALDLLEHLAGALRAKA